MLYITHYEAARTFMVLIRKMCAFMRVEKASTGIGGPRSVSLYLYNPWTLNVIINRY